MSVGTKFKTRCGRGNSRRQHGATGGTAQPSAARSPVSIFPMRPLGTGVSVRFIAEVRLQSILLLLLALTPASALRASPSFTPAARVTDRPVHVVALAARVRKRDRAKALFNRVRGKAPPPVEAALPPGAAFPAPPPPGWPRAQSPSARSSASGIWLASMR